MITLAFIPTGNTTAGDILTSESASDLASVGYFSMYLDNDASLERRPRLLGGTAELQGLCITARSSFSVST